MFVGKTQQPIAHSNVPQTHHGLSDQFVILFGYTFKHVPLSNYYYILNYIQRILEFSCTQVSLSANCVSAGFL